MLNEVYGRFALLQSRGVTIANGASLSDAVDIGSAIPVAIQMPADWTAADLTFQASWDNDTFFNVYDSDDSEVTIQAAEDRFIVITDPAKWLGVRYLKVRSGTSGAAVNQNAARSLKLVLLP